MTTKTATALVNPTASATSAIKGEWWGVAAAATILSISLIWIGFGKRGEPIPLGRWFGFMAPIWTYQICLNGIL
ncbi:MAG: hypothetical protein E4H00_02515, partial [Myxococcales bacterium]